MVVKELVTLVLIALPREPCLYIAYFCAFYNTMFEAFVLDETVEAL